MHLTPNIDAVYALTSLRAKTLAARAEDSRDNPNIGAPHAVGAIG
jgi:hypothetical protein